MDGEWTKTFFHWILVSYLTIVINLVADFTIPTNNTLTFAYITNHLRMSNNRHPMDGAMVLVGSKTNFKELVGFVKEPTVQGRFFDPCFQKNLGTMVTGQN
jgi:hypothetical protein